MAAAMTATRCARHANPRDGTGAPTPLRSLTLISFYPVPVRVARDLSRWRAEGSRPAPFAPFDASL